MKNIKLGLAIVLFFIAIGNSIIVQASGPSISFIIGEGGLSDSNDDVQGDGIITGLNMGYQFNDILGLNVEYFHVGGDGDFDFRSVFLGIKTSTTTYIKGKIGVASTSADVANNESLLLGIGLGREFNDSWALEIEHNLGAGVSYRHGSTNLLLKYNF